MLHDGAQLRSVAVVRCRGGTAESAGGSEAKFQAVAEQLKAQGATLVLKDEGSLKVTHWWRLSHTD